MPTIRNKLNALLLYFREQSTITFLESIYRLYAIDTLETLEALLDRPEEYPLRPAIEDFFHAQWALIANTPFAYTASHFNVYFRR